MIPEQFITLGIFSLCAVIGGMIANKLKQPVVLGLLIVGTLIGPTALNIAKDTESINLMIELGAIMLLFLVGLEFSLQKIMKVGFRAMIITLLKTGITFFIGYTAGIFIGLTPVVSALIGVILSFTSTVVFVKILEQKGMIKRIETPLLLAVLIFEDVFAVIGLTVLSTLTSAHGKDMLSTFEHLLFGLTILVILYIVLAKFAERFVTWVMKNAGEEVITFVSFGICLGLSFVAYMLGLSPSAGAFLAGSIVSTFKNSKSFEHSIKPYAVICGSLFFIAIGTIIDFGKIMEYKSLIIILLGVLVFSRLVAVGITTYVFANFRKEQAFFSSIAMFSVGEFSLLIAKESMKLNLGIDLVTITSVIIFVTAVLMSFGISYASNITESSFNKSFGFISTGSRFRSLANYIDSFFNQVDTETTDTNKFKKNFYNNIVLTVMMFFILVTIKKHVLPYIVSLGEYYYEVPLFIITGAAIITMMVVMYKKVNSMSDLLVKIMTKLDAYMNSRKARSLLINLVLWIVFLVLALFSPLITIALHVDGGIFQYTPQALLAISVYFLLSTTNKLQTHKYTVHSIAMPSFKRFEEKDLMPKDIVPRAIPRAQKA